MPNIDIRHKHKHTLAQAKKAINETARTIGEKFGVTSQWKGNTLSFERPGMNGEIRVSAHEVHITAQLGFLFSALKPMIEREIQHHLDDGLA